MTLSDRSELPSILSVGPSQGLRLRPGPAAAADEIRGRLERLDGPPLQTNASRY
jgi:hypothetical protein